MDLERVKTRVSCLLQVARDDAATEGEIENAIRAARNLMLAYHLEEADLESTGDAQSSQMGRATSRTNFGKAALWEKDLAYFVVDLIGGVCWYYSRNNVETRRLVNGRLRQFGAVVFYGIEEEAQLAKETYEELATTIFTMAMAKYGSAYRGDGGIYAEGFVQGLSRQLRNADRQAESSGRDLVARSTAIVLAKKNRAEHWLRYECNIHLTRGTRSYGASGSDHAWDDGESDGRNCDVSGVGAKRAKLSGMPKLLR
jgi:hypothetical protein